MDNLPIFVLVHGAGLGGWCWQRVKKILVSHGFKVFTPTLTGMTAQTSETETADAAKIYSRRHECYQV